MKNLTLELNKIISQISGESDIELNIPEDVKHGDLTTNVAMKLAAKRKLPPMEIAAEFVKDLLADKLIKENFSQVKAVQPGFINFYYSANYLQNELAEIIKQDDYGSQGIGKGKTIVIEYSSPNTNKPLHVGHLRNNALGMALANVFEFLGYKVIKTSVVNDRGIHIMKSMLAYQKWGNNETPDKLGIKGDKLVGDYYVKYNEAANKNPDIIDEAQAMLKKWEDGDKEVRQLWQQMNKWVYAGWQDTYDKYGSKFDHDYYESNLYDKGREIITKAAKQKLVYKKDDGATVVDLSAYGLGGRESGEKVLLRPNGTTVYITQDIYLAVKRYQDYHFDKMIYLVGDEQLYHFQVLFKILELLQFTWVKSCLHYDYAHVLLPEGKMKSREGKVVDGDDLIDDLIALAKNEVGKRRDDVTTKEIDRISEAVALAAIKYWFLKSNPKSSIHFDPKESLSFEGNTGPYLLYTFVRLQSILAKAGKVKKKVKGVLGEDELGLVRKMSEWPKVVSGFSKHYNSNIICEYLYSLASEVNSYYHAVNILKADKEIREVRLQTILAASQILKTGLKLLNIETVDKM